MAGIVVFHVVMLVLVLSIVSRVVPTQRVSDTLGYLHNAIGITMPSVAQARMISMIWIGSVIVMVDGCLFLLVFISRLSHAG
jgi:hypothetical protein